MVEPASPTAGVDIRRDDALKQRHARACWPRPPPTAFRTGWRVPARYCTHSIDCVGVLCDVTRGSPCASSPPHACARRGSGRGAFRTERTASERSGSLKFLAIGDNGTGDRAAVQAGAADGQGSRDFPFDLVIMLGDNMYGGQSPSDYVKKFEQPYAPLLAAGVRFQASLGNHDRPEQVSYKLYNMNGQRYYTYVRNNVRFLRPRQHADGSEAARLARGRPAGAREEWKISYFHHPLYSNAARHGSSVDLRVLLEPLFIKYGVNVVFSGHDHVYERVEPQKGIYYFVSGAAAS